MKKTKAGQGDSGSVSGPGVEVAHHGDSVNNYEARGPRKRTNSFCVTL